MQGKEFNKPLLSKDLWVIFMPFVAVPSLFERFDWSENGGSRAEVRRERKKRDILSPANVL